MFVALATILLVAACAADDLCYKDAVRACKTTVSKQGRVFVVALFTVLIINL